MPRPGENWTCPYCGRAQVISSDRFRSDWERLRVEECEAGTLGYNTEAIVCANNDCKSLSLRFRLVERREKPNSGWNIGAVLLDARLLPASFSKPQPEYIPEPLRKDYQEACAIRDLSPKASATLTRRCIQGIIRDFCGVARKRLVDEINELRGQTDSGNAPAGVQPDVVDAIDHVRSIGNIGAHMEADINLIVDVDPGEAQILIELVELLFAEWYVAPAKRAARLKELGFIADAKKAIREQKKLPPPESGIPVTPQNGVTAPRSS